MQKAYISLSIDIFVNKIQFLVNITYFFFFFICLILSLVFNFVTEQKKIYYMSLNNIIDLSEGFSVNLAVIFAFLNYQFVSLPFSKQN